MKKNRNALIVVALALLISSIYYFGIFLPDLKEDEFIFNKKKECPSLCQPLYDIDVKWLPEGGVLSPPEYAYNKELNTCLYSNSQKIDSSNQSFQYVFDCSSNEELLFHLIKNGELIRDMPLEEFKQKKYELMSIE